MAIHDAREIHKATLEKNIFTESMNNKIITMITGDYDMVYLLKEIDAVVRNLRRLPKQHFNVTWDKRSKRHVLDISDIGERLKLLLKRDLDSIINDQHFFDHNPYVSVFMKCWQDRNLRHCSDILTVASLDQAQRTFDLLNGFVHAIRQECQRPSFRKATSNHLRAARKDMNSLMKYIDALFEKYSRLLILRIDFGYAQTSTWEPALSPSVNHSNVTRHRKELLRYLNSSLPDGSFVGYAWKLEFGYLKTYHYHVMIFLDGSKVREDVTIAKMIGDHWNKQITNMRGCYFNCNAIKSEYKSCGIGMVHHGDTNMREGLRKAAVYMTKTDYYAKMIIPGNARSFGKGIMPRQKKGNLGRPRSVRIRGDAPTVSL